MPWLKSAVEMPVVVAIDPRWHQRDEIWDLSDAEYRSASIAEYKRLADIVRARHARARAVQARANRQHGVNRRAHERGATGSHTTAQWIAVVEQHGGACLYCGRTDRPLTRDHVVSLKRGGPNDIGNIVPACRSCNSRKGAR